MTRRWLGVGAVLLLLVAGCDLEGTVRVSDDDRATVDLRVSEVVQRAANDSLNSYRWDCSAFAQVDGLTSETLTDPSRPDWQGCRVTGTVPLSKAVTLTVEGLLQKVSGHYLFRVPSHLLPPVASAGPVGEPSRVRAGRVDLSVTLPGTPVAHDDSGRLDGNTVHWSDPSPRPQGGLVFVTRADSEPDPALGPLLAGALGVVSGAALSLAAVSALARRTRGPSGRDRSGEHRERREGAPEESLTTRDDVLVAPPGVSAGADPPEDPSVWAPDADG